MNCEWQWGEWEPNNEWHCNKPCGGGKQVRKKYIKKPAEDDGTCDTPTVQERPCNEEKCKGETCLIANLQMAN